MYRENQSLSAHDTEKFLLAFYSQYNRYVYKLAWQYGKNVHDVDELVQEVWLNYCEMVDNLMKVTQENQMTYIAASVRNTAVSIARKKRPEYPLEVLSDITYDEAEILNNVFDKQLKIQHFQRLWPQVPYQAREILERKYILMESDAQIGTAMGIGAASVRMYLTRARKVAFSTLAEYKESLI